MQHQSPDVGLLVVTLIVVLVFLGTISLLYWVARGRICIVRGTNREPDAGRQRANTPLWLWLVLIVGLALIFWSFRPRGADAEGRAAAPPLAPRVALFVAVGFFALFVAVIAVQIIRTLDFGVRRAEKRAAAGDLEGGIADLREQIGEKGLTLQRANALGLLLLRDERFDEAAEMFRKGMAMPGMTSVCQANLGLALVKGGKAEEALAVLQKAGRIRPPARVLSCVVALHTARALAAVGRWDEAEQQFRDAQALATALAKSQRESLEQELDRLRLKLAERPGASKKSERLDEL